MPASLAEATIVVPGVPERVVTALLDFLYTGEMTVDREDTADLQVLIENLQIDPSLISVDTKEEAEEKKKTEEKDSEKEKSQSNRKRRASLSGCGKCSLIILMRRS